MIDEWAAGVIAHLTSAFATAEIEDGELDGVQRDRDVIAVWWPGWDEITRDTSLAAPRLNLRYFPARSKQPAATAPASGSPIRQAADALLVTFDRASQVPGFFAAGLSCRITTIRPNYDPAVWRVDATLLAYTLGAAA